MNCNNASLYKLHAYTIVNNRLDIASSLISSFLLESGYQSLPIPAAERTDIDNAIPTVSHKMIAHLAGLGWIGKNCLLITPAYGPRIRLTSILTNAEIDSNTTIIQNQCGQCNKCIEICPSHALLGREYIDGEEREKRMDYRKCEMYYEEMGKNEKIKAVCGMCLYICPFGRKRTA